MRKTTTKILTTVLCLGFIGVSNAQTYEVYEDDFSVDVADYFTADLTSTPWEGINVNTSLDVNNTSVATAQATGGQLVLTSSGADFENSSDDGLYLYRTIPTGNDFEVSVQLVGGSFATYTGTVNYNAAGIIIRDANHSPNFIYSHFFDNYGIHTVIKKNVDGEKEELSFGAGDYLFADYTWMKLTKVDNVFTVYLSMDGSTWSDGRVVDFPALAGMDLEVGLAHASFSEVDPAPAAILDNYKLVINPNALSIADLSELDFLEIYTSANGVVIDNNSSKSLESVKLYNVVGSMVYQATNIKAGNYTIHQSNSGVYIVEIVTDGLRYSKKVIITE